MLEKVDPLMYQEGDIARLLEIERQHHLQEEIDLKTSTKSQIERLCLQRERDNELLATQYDNLKREGSIARNSPEGEMVKEYRAAKKQGLQKNLTKSDSRVRGLLFKVTG